MSTLEKHIIPLKSMHLYRGLHSFYDRDTCYTNARAPQHPKCTHMGTPEKPWLGCRSTCICSIKGQYHLQQQQQDNQTGLLSAKMGNVYLQSFSSSFVVHSFHTSLQGAHVYSSGCCMVSYCLFSLKKKKKEERFKKKVNTPHTQNKEKKHWGC